MLYALISHVCLIVALEWGYSCPGGMNPALRRMISYYCALVTLFTIEDLRCKSANDVAISLFCVTLCDSESLYNRNDPGVDQYTSAV